jgi:outer membrane biogenesis lipoprotein LolB
MKTVRVAVPALVLAVLAACTTTSEPGWTGTDAAPFDASLSECQRAVAHIPLQATHEAKLAECMAAKGWTREGD